jgi:Tol biopolymer transport system component
MTRSQRPAARPSTGRASRIPSLDGIPIAAVLSVVGLVLIAVVTLSLTSGNLAFLTGGNGGPGPNGSGDPGVVARTPTPSNVIVVPSEQPGLEVPGTLVYAKDGNIWVQAAGTATQLTTGGQDSMPSFAPDGTAVYFVRTRRVIGLWNVSGVRKPYRMDVPSLMSIAPSGGDATTLLDGLVDPAGPLKWMGFIREPVLSPDGRTMAMASDLPDPTRSDVVITTWDLTTKKLTDLGLSQVAPLGHQDPAWRPDGLRLAYVRSDRDGAKGVPRIYGYNVETGKSAPLTGPGYLHPSWSPDGRYLAVTRTTAFGTDVAILDARTGAELLRLTSDGESWAPAWSPRGDQIAYLHVAGQVVDLRMVQLDGAGPSWTIKETVDLTTSAGLDGVSRPGWFVPAADLPSPAPTDTPSSPAASDTPSASPAAP